MSKFATSVLFMKNRGEEATGSWDTPEEGQNIKKNELSVSFRVWLFKFLLQFPQRRDFRDNGNLVDTPILDMIIFCIYFATGKQFGL